MADYSELCEESERINEYQHRINSSAAAGKDFSIRELFPPSRSFETDWPACSSLDP
ncbi:hypothetical protein Pint_18232 [Pistacia integerrima]|uniref:Uncharacterized protein n=1 Tax=Pistacia integerrima TaxID=434235 RepID=A0ACC0YXH2_9ROSI|nr:hypothetical protein Pint_18232 [Pistacia integerrima]